jgi:hypothetical protein
MAMRHAAVALVAALFAARAAGQQPPKLHDVLTRAAAYVRHFENDFAAVVTDEAYDQDDFHGQPSVRVHDHRRIRSEMLFMPVPGQGLLWLTSRNVLEVDGHAVPDSRDRLEQTIKGDASGLADRLRSVADEGARFNLGKIHRNFNDPILPLLFLDPDYQSRFKFRLEKSEDIDGVQVQRVSFKETERSTVIKQQVDGKNLFTTGSLWVRAEDGVVVRTELSAAATAASFVIRVDYRRDPKLDMWIPARMVEHYRDPKTLEEVDCTATYSNARRFETSGRVIVK